METIQQVVQVNFHYPVHFTTKLFDLSNPLLRDLIRAQVEHAPKKMLFVVDAGVSRHHPGLLRSILSYCTQHNDILDLVAQPIVIEGGEESKNQHDHVTLIHEAIDRYGLDRHAYVVAVGGGAILDMVGYAAATAHRGVRLIRVPTTVLSQNDSGVGVKNSVNAFGKKNFLGTFAPPSAVLNDFSFLTTLSDRDWRGGISEAVKVALLKDVEFFEFLEEHANGLLARKMEPMKRLVYRCAELHLEHIAASGDPFESGSSRPLDFGHWSAHKLEQLSHYRLRHGEAVAIGIALDTTYSYLSGMLEGQEWRRILNLFIAVGLPLYAPELHAPARGTPYAVLDGLEEFREHLGGELTIMLLQGIGEGVEVHEMDRRRIIESIGRLQEYQDTQMTGGRKWVDTKELAHSRNGS